MVNILRSIGDRSLRSMVDLDKGVVDREIYVNEEIYQQEMEQIFARCWLFVGHESMVPEPGDFIISRMGAEEVIISRDRKNKQIHVFLNTCMHRGEKVCRYDEGNTLVFTCPFHGWSYDTDGRLVGVAYYKESYNGEQLDKSKWGLHEATVCNYYGSIWATWDKKAPSFEDYVGAYAPSIRHCMQSSDGEDNGMQVFKPIIKWRIPTNWKVPGFTSSTDPAHAAMTHRSVNAAAIGPQGDDGVGNRAPVRAPFPAKSWVVGNHQLGHGGGYTFYEQPGVPEYVNTWMEPGVDDYYRAQRDKKAEKYKDVIMPGRGHGGGHFCVWPNVVFDFWRIRPWHPNGVGSTESFRLFPVDKNAPQEVKDAQRHYVMRYNGPVGMTESDDMENWNYVYPASQGTIARTLPYNFESAIHRGWTDPRLPGFTISQNKSEEAQRARFSRWLDFMEAGSWDDLYPVYKGENLHNK